MTACYFKQTVIFEHQTQFIYELYLIKLIHFIPINALFQLRNLTLYNISCVIEIV